MSTPTHGSLMLEAFRRVGQDLHSASNEPLSGQATAKSGFLLKLKDIV